MSNPDSVIRMTKYTFGMDPVAVTATDPAVAVGTALAWAAWLVWRRGGSKWIFFAVVVFAYPLFFALGDPPIPTAHRYFVVSALFALMLAADAIAAGLARGGGARVAAAVLLAAFVIGNGALLAKFFTYGRGEYAAAVRLIAASAHGPATVSGTHPLAVAATLTHHAAGERVADRIRHVAPAGEAGAPARFHVAWFSDFDFARRPPPARIERPVAGAGTIAYEAIGVFPYWGLSGVGWAVYRRRD